MIRPLIISAIAKETFLRLRRDKVFLPTSLVGLVVMFMSGIISFWGVEEFYKILFDLTTTSFNLIGVVVAIFWGTKIIHDSKQEGSIELQLAAPLCRYEWLLGKYIGLASVLVLLALVLMFGLQLVYLWYGMSFMPMEAWIIFSTLSLTWLVISAASMLIASLSSQAVSLFTSFWLLICGLIARPVLQALPPDSPDFVKQTVSYIAGIWDLHRFNLSEFGSKLGELNWSYFLHALSYASGLIVFILASAVISFRYRDLT